MENFDVLHKMKHAIESKQFPSVNVLEAQAFLQDFTAQVEAATLRAVGEAFEARSFVVASNMPELDGKTAVYLEQSDLTDLRNGQMPAGWEKE